MTDAAERDRLLFLSDALLLRECRQEDYRGSGPGGQRRNKVATAVRLVHSSTGLTAHAEESRSRRENRQQALRRLRERMAVTIRRPFDLAVPSLPAAFEMYRSRAGQIRINPANAAYPIVIASALDALAAADGSYARAAQALGLTTSQLLRLLRSDASVWREVAAIRDAGPGLTP